MAMLHSFGEWGETKDSKNALTMTLSHLGNHLSAAVSWLISSVPTKYSGLYAVCLVFSWRNEGVRLPSPSFCRCPVVIHLDSFLISFMNIL